MDVERGNIEILFKKMNYLDISGQANSGKLALETEHTYRKINRELYMHYARSVFINMTDNERDNSYHLACEQIKNAQGNNPCVFRLLINLAKRLLSVKRHTVGGVNGRLISAKVSPRPHSRSGNRRLTAA